SRGHAASAVTSSSLSMRCRFHSRRLLAEPKRRLLANFADPDGYTRPSKGSREKDRHSSLAPLRDELSPAQSRTTRRGVVVAIVWRAPQQRVCRQFLIDVDDHGIM